MAKIIVEVMLKPEILDPQGQAVASALPRLGFNFATSVRQGKVFEIEVKEVTDQILKDVNVAAEKLLSNPVIENFVVRVES
jgi:phosphoribosylformylglycinamidine synthase subunit PurS